MIKTWQQRCEGHPDHEGIVTEQMIRERMQEEIDELRQALAQHVDKVDISEERVHKTEKSIHEPVAWIHDGGKGELWWYRSSKFDEEGNLIGYNPDDVPLYTAPPKRKWVGLTNDERKQIVSYIRDPIDWVPAVEAKLKEKNT